MWQHPFPVEKEGQPAHRQTCTGKHAQAHTQHVPVISFPHMRTVVSGTCRKHLAGHSTGQRGDSHICSAQLRRGSQPPHNRVCAARRPAAPEPAGALVPPDWGRRHWSSLPVRPQLLTQHWTPHWDWGGWTASCWSPGLGRVSATTTSDSRTF